jgi:hypothetical protein
MCFPGDEGTTRGPLRNSGRNQSLLHGALYSVRVHVIRVQLRLRLRLPKKSTPCGGGVEHLHRDLASSRRRRKGSLNSETVKYGHESKGNWTQERLRWQWPAAYTKDRLVLSSERARGSTPRLTDWLTVSRNVTWTLTLTLSSSSVCCISI